MSHLAASFNSLAEVNARKMMIEEKDCKSLLEFRREEAEKTQEHKKYVAELYLRMMNHRHSTNPNPFVHNQVSSSFISPSEFTPPMSSSTPPFSPVSRIGALSNRFQSSSTQPLNGKTFTFQFPQINNNWLNSLNINHLSAHSWTLELFCYVPTCFLFSSRNFYIGGYLKEENVFIL